MPARQKATRYRNRLAANFCRISGLSRGRWKATLPPPSQGVAILNFRPQFAERRRNRCLEARPPAVLVEVSREFLRVSEHLAALRTLTQIGKYRQKVHVGIREAASGKVACVRDCLVEYGDMGFDLRQNLFNGHSIRLAIGCVGKIMAPQIGDERQKYPRIGN